MAHVMPHPLAAPLIFWQGRVERTLSGMDLQLTDEQQMVQKVAAEFAKNEVLPKAAEVDRLHRHPKELVARLAELGFMGIAIPEEYGGAGLDTISYVLVMEELSRACASVGVITSVNNSLVCDPLFKFGTEEQKRKWLTPLASGKLLGCFALSEPEAGSDAAAQKTIAKPSGDGFVINGVKNWITNGPVADVCILFTMANPPGREAGHKAITAFILPMDTAGVRTGPPDKKLGIRGSQSCQIFLDEVRLGREHLLGEVGITRSAPRSFGLAGRGGDRVGHEGTLQDEPEPVMVWLNCACTGSCSRPCCSRRRWCR